MCNFFLANAKSKNAQTNNLVIKGDNCFAGIHVVRYLTGNAKVPNSNHVQEFQDAYY